MTRVDESRAGARQACSARRERISATPTRLTLPLVSAVVVIGAVAVVSSALGLSLGLVLAVTLAVAVIGAGIAHRAVGSVLAGVTLLVVRPYGPGERVRLQSPVTGDLVDAEVVRVGLANTTLVTASGLLVVPNARLLRGTPPEPECGTS